MATAVKVTIDRHAFIAATTGPGGTISRWADDTADEIVSVARSMSPTNNAMNAVHRGGVVGTYRAAWGRERGRHANQYGTSRVIYNTADHAEFVEFGRSPSFAPQRFSWDNWTSLPPGTIAWVRHTGGRRGRHILRDAANAVMPGATGGVYTPLT